MWLGRKRRGAVESDARALQGDGGIVAKRDYRAQRRKGAVKVGGIGARGPRKAFLKARHVAMPEAPKEVPKPGRVPTRAEDEHFRLREAVNAEKQRVLDLKRAEHNRKAAWREEMQHVGSSKQLQLAHAEDGPVRRILQCLFNLLAHVGVAIVLADLLRPAARGRHVIGRLGQARPGHHHGGPAARKPARAEIRPACTCRRACPCVRMISPITNHGVQIDLFTSQIRTTR